MAYVEGDFPLSMGNGNSNNGYDGFGGWWGIIALIAVAAIFGGGWGFGGYGGSAGGGAAMQGALTREQACIDNNFNNLSRNVEGIANSVNVGFANLNSTICAQQYDTAQMINSMNISNLQSANALQSQLATCCCNIERGIERLGCEAASNTAAIIQSQNAGTQRIIDYLCNEKIEALRAENVQLSNAISQANQTRTLIDTLLPVARPAYITCSPYASAFGFPYGGYGYNGNSGCCGCNG